MDAEQHEKRSQEIADTTRRIAVTLNGGAIGIAFTLAGAAAPAGKSIATWPLIAVPAFVLGLLFVGVSLFLAKDRELARRDAARENRLQPDYSDKPWMWSFNWDLGAFAAFGLGALVGLVTAMRYAS